MRQRTLVLIKRHMLSGSCGQAIVDIQSRYLEAGLHMEGLKWFSLHGRQIRKLYRQHFGKAFFPELEKDMTGDCIAMIWSGRNAVKTVRMLNGATRVAEAKPGTIRRKYGDPNNLTNNAVHSSESSKAAEREIHLIFGKNV
ncbi:MAG: nucleoside-diphosphate kinase [bacterium]|nr:nucleoside-diphosphate kinase [bacterium]